MDFLMTSQRTDFRIDRPPTRARFRAGPVVPTSRTKNLE